MRFAIICLMAAAVSGSAINPNYPSGNYGRYNLVVDNSPVDQDVNADAGKGDDNTNNIAIADGWQNNRVTNVDGSGNNLDGGIYNANSPIRQRVTAGAGQGNNNYGNLAQARGFQDNGIYNENRPENPSGIDLPNSPVYQEAIARVENGDNLAIADAQQDNRLRNTHKSYINAPDSPEYQTAQAEATGSDNDTRPRTAIANVYQDNSVENGNDSQPQIQKGTAIASGYGNFDSKATVNNKDD